MSTTASPDATAATPEPIIGTLMGIVAAQYLMVAGEVGLFEQLGDDALTAEELGQRTGLPTRSARILGDCLAAWGLLEKAEGRYRNGPATLAFLSGGTPIDLRPYVHMSHTVMYQRLGQFEETFRTGGGAHTGQFHVSDETQRIMSEGIQSLTAPSAAMLAASFDFGGFGRLLDVAGGPGNHLDAVLQRHAQLVGTLFELPSVAAQARERLAPLIEAGRAQVVEGDVFADQLPTGHDVVLLSQTLHLFTPEPNKDLLGRIRRSVEPGARLLLVDMWTNADRTEPLPAALSAGIFYQLTGGDVYSVDEAKGWLAETGWAFLGHRPLAGPESLIEAEAAS